MNMDKGKKKALMSVVGGIGLIVLIVGVTTDLYETMTGVFIALAIWIIGVLLLYVLGLGVEKENAAPATPEVTEAPATPEVSAPAQPEQPAQASGSEEGEDHVAV